jgi:hypothetical protein
MLMLLDSSVLVSIVLEMGFLVLNIFLYLVVKTPISPATVLEPSTGFNYKKVLW